MMNLEQLDWDHKALELLGIEKSITTTCSNYTCFNWNEKRYATLMGIDEQTPVIVGASDGVLSNLGVNSYQKGEVAVTIGTSGAIRTVINQPKQTRRGVFSVIFSIKINM